MGVIGQGLFHIVALLLQYIGENQAKKPKPTFISYTLSIRMNCNCPGSSLQSRVPLFRYLPKVPAKGVHCFDESTSTSISRHSGSAGRDSGGRAHPHRPRPDSTSDAREDYQLHPPALRYSRHGQDNEIG